MRHVSYVHEVQPFLQYRQNGLDPKIPVDGTGAGTCEKSGFRTKDVNVNEVMRRKGEDKTGKKQEERFKQVSVIVIGQ